MLDATLYQSMFARSPIGTIVLSASADPVILDVNDAFLRDVGHTREQLVGRLLFAALPAAPGDPDDPYSNGVTALRNALARVLASGEPQSLTTQRYPIRSILPDGREVFVKRFWSMTNTPIFGADGSLRCIQHVSIGGTARKQAEEALLLSQREALDAARQAEAERARLGAVLQAAPVGIVLADTRGKVIDANAAHDALWCRHCEPGAAPLDFSEWKGWWADGSARHGQALAVDEWPLAAALRGEPSAHHLIEIETFGASRARRIVVCSAAPIRGHDGQVDAAVVVLLDMTERLRAENALRDADRRKDEFLAMLAHELRNPLAPIMAAAELLVQDATAPAGVKQASAIIGRQARHLAGLVDDLLDVSRITRGLAVIDKSPLDLGTVVAEAVEQVQPLVASRGHRLVLDVQAAPLTVCGDRKRLVQVVANLLNNAAKYTPPGGRIRLAAQAEAGRARLSVSDNGIGMTRELMGRAFELFAQAERDADRAQGGLGIGLAVVRRLVELHGGQIAVDSGGPGQGSCFTLTLPLAPGAAHAGGAQAPQLPAAAGQALEVLVVDDNRDAAQMLGIMVQHFGHAVRTVHTAGEALAQARLQAADVYLLDIGLPGMDGHELARRLRAEAAGAGAVLVAVTGYGGEEAQRAALAAGFDYHFVKPVKGGDLRLLLRDIARARGRGVQERSAAGGARGRYRER